MVKATSFILFMGERKLGADHFKARKSIFVVAKQPSLFIHETGSSLPTTLVGKKWRIRVQKIDKEYLNFAKSGHTAFL